MKNKKILIIVGVIMLLFIIRPFRQILYLDRFFIKNLQLERKSGGGLFPWDLDYFTVGSYEDMNGNVYNLYINDGTYRDDYYSKYYKNDVNNALDDIIKKYELNIQLRDRSMSGSNPYYHQKGWVFPYLSFEKFMKYHLVEVEFDVELDWEADLEETAEEMTEFAKDLIDEGFYFRIYIDYRHHTRGFSYWDYNEKEMSENLEAEVRKAVENVYYDYESTVEKIEADIVQKITDNTDFNPPTEKALEELRRIIYQDYEGHYPAWLDGWDNPKEIGKDYIKLDVEGFLVTFDAEGNLQSVDKNDNG